MKPINKICILMFDEIALSPGLQHNARTDSIEGFLDYGGSNRRPAFADHALTFMLKGIHKKWKQTVCFTFCEGTTSTDQLVSILKEVVRHVRKCGLQRVATISPSNTKYLYYMKEIFIKYYIVFKYLKDISNIY
jgi:hypothetical protein